MKVLLVDDEDDIRKIAKVSLQAVGRFETLTASSAPEGIELAKRERPDLLLLDMMMPGMDGLRALEEIRRTPELCAIPVIFLTAKVQRDELEHYVACGAVGVIQKPFNPMTLPSDVLRLLASGRRPVGPDSSPEAPVLGTSLPTAAGS
jgi:CheY-like chemotaxis protein